MSETTAPPRTYTPEENNAIAHRFFKEAWNHGNLSIIDELIHPEAIDHSTVAGKHKTEKGGASFRQIITMFREAMPDIQLEIEDDIYSGDKVVHRWVLEGTHESHMMGVPPTNKRIRFSGTTVVRMRDGLIVERWTHIDELGLLQQLGIVPTPEE